MDNNIFLICFTAMIAVIAIIPFMILKIYQINTKLLAAMQNNSQTMAAHLQEIVRSIREAHGAIRQDFEMNSVALKKVEDAVVALRESLEDSVKF